MELKTVRETVYGDPLIGRNKKKYFVYLRGERVGYGDTKEEAQKRARQSLSDAYTYITRACEVRTACDGTILVFRQLSDTTAMYEYVRNGRGGSSCLGQMTDGNGNMLRSLAAYADYVVRQYDEPEITVRIPA
jgi:hypothetical protein